MRAYGWVWLSLDYSILMNPLLALGVLVGYFLLLVLISAFTGGKGSNKDFFSAGRSSSWYLVAFGMIGASLSGVTFISIPGYVGGAGWSYLWMVLGYWVGYQVIIYKLLPLYYRQGHISIYGFLNDRFGPITYKTGAWFFVLSRTIGSAFRLFLVAKVLQIAILDSVGLPFWAAVLLAVLLIWIYTYRSGIRTIVITDTVQTLAMLVCVVLTIYIIKQALDLSFLGLVSEVWSSDTSNIWYVDPLDSKFFLKNFLAGIFITIVMTGLDQDMMQKNLSCRTLEDSQKNMRWFSLLLIAVNILFLFMGSLLFIYADHMHIALPTKSDELFPMLAFGSLGIIAGLVFLIGVTAAAYSSADSALTALTTSFCIDILGISQDENTANLRTRKWVHLTFTLVMSGVVIAFDLLNNSSVVSAVFTAAGYTYGPLLGLFAYGIFHQKPIKDAWVPVFAVLAPVLTACIQYFSSQFLGGYQIGFELLLINGGLMYLMLNVFKGVRIKSMS